MARRPTNRPLDLDGPTPLAVHIVLDASGSMSAVRTDTVGGFADYVSTLHRETPGAVVGLTTFNDNVRTEFIDRPVSTVENIDSSYHCGGWTALYDAIKAGIDALDSVTAETKALVIITDGQDNYSRANDKASIRDLLLDRQENHNWLVTYLGANQDAFAEGSSLGIGAGTTMAFNASRGDTTRRSFAAASASTTRYTRSGGNLMSASYTDSERDDAIGLRPTRHVSVDDLAPTAPDLTWSDSNDTGTNSDSGGDSGGGSSFDGGGGDAGGGGGGSDF